ncbi:MAG TPA: class I SAM-dependent methyltransferase [Paucimonas sp.]|nr:class I SAM-dependent methyltransferase [Paucimonas sp.]
MADSRYQAELDAIAARYTLRELNGSVERYSWLRPEVHLAACERDRAILRLFAGIGLKDLSRVSLLEVGCGGGGNLLRFLQWGFDPVRLVGNELLPDRLDMARRRLPQQVRLIGGDASTLDGERLGGRGFDIVYQSTVFSSILDDALQAQLAQRMWTLARPGGGVLWYDFRVDNPRNRDVRGVPLRRIRELFPQSVPVVRRVTLAPPIARALARAAPRCAAALYAACNALPALRTHLLCWIPKETVSHE